MSYQDTVAEIAARAEADLVAITRRWQAKEITDQQHTVETMAVLILAISEAAAVADAGAAIELTRLWKRHVLPLGLVADPENIDTDLRILVIDMVASDTWEADPEAATGVLARAVVLGTAAEVYGTALRKQGVKRWTRLPNSGACEICMELADGSELPMDQEMWHHKGCGCVQKPTE